MCFTAPAHPCTPDVFTRIVDMGYPEGFIWMWEFYLCYCEGGFLERVISDVHLVADKPLISSHE